MLALSTKAIASRKLQKMITGELSRQLKNKIADRLDDIADEVGNEVRHQLSIGPKDMPAYTKAQMKRWARKHKVKLSVVKKRIEKLRFKKNVSKHLRVRTGRLRASITTRVSRSQLRATVGPQRVKYAAIHEYGGSFKAWGKHPAVMPARPYLEPAVKKLKPWVINQFKEAIRSVTVGSS